jgi:hypothetical protein
MTPCEGAWVSSDLSLGLVLLSASAQYAEATFGSNNEDKAKDQLPPFIDSLHTPFPPRCGWTTSRSLIVTVIVDEIIFSQGQKST